jgi:L-ascorbate metabolism protein UlaG (beta-lactamase superfamily)
LVDPVFSGNASPVSFFGKNFKGSNEYKISDFPAIDMVIITHDHYDHMDYKTILELKNKTKHFYTSLGVGAHLNLWGIDNSAITEFDWWDSIQVTDKIFLTAAPGRHFSGRKFKRNQSLWASYILQTPTEKIFLGGDSGFDTHFKEIGQKYGPFDLALLECGQYNKMWGYIHMMPDEVVQAAIDLKTKVLMPVHWSKFTLALHPWNEPIKKVSIKAKEMKMPITTPLIGEVVTVNQHYPDSIWWEF